MSAEDVVGAALAGLDQGAFITLPSLPDKAELDALEHARDVLAPYRPTRNVWPLQDCCDLTVSLG